MAGRTPSSVSRSISLHSDDDHSPLLEPSADFQAAAMAQQDTGASPKTVDGASPANPPSATTSAGGVVRRTRERRDGQERLIQILVEVSQIVGGFGEVFEEGSLLATTMDALGPIQHRLRNLTLIPSGGESAAAQFVSYVYGEARRGVSPSAAEEDSSGITGYANKYRQAADELLRADELVKLLRETILGATRRFRPDAPQQSAVAWHHYHRQLVEIRTDLLDSLTRSKDLVRTLPLLSEMEQEELAGSPRSRQFIALHQPTNSIVMENVLASEYVMSSPSPTAAHHHERPDVTTPQQAGRTVHRPPRGVEDEVNQVVTGNSNHRAKDATRMQRAAEDALESARQTVTDLEDENQHLRSSNGELRRQLHDATSEVEEAVIHMEADFSRRAEHIAAKEAALVRQDYEKKIRDVHAKYERTISDLQRNHKTSLNEQDEAWRVKVGLNGKDHATDIHRVEAECKKKLTDMERECNKRVREERERSQRQLDAQQTLCTQTEAKKHEDILSRIKKRHRAVMADLEKKLSDEIETSQARKRELENAKLMLSDSERRRGALETQLTEITRSSKDFEVKSREATKERQALERDTEYLMTELLSLQQTVAEYRREQRSINSVVNNVVSVRREDQNGGDKRRHQQHSWSKSGVSTPREPSRTLFDERSPPTFSQRYKASINDDGRGHERGTSPVGDSLHCPSSVLNQTDDDVFMGSLIGSVPSSPARRQPSQTWRSTANHRRPSPSNGGGYHTGIRRGEASQHSPLGGGHVPNQSAEFQVSPATDDRRPLSSSSAGVGGGAGGGGSSSAMSPSVRRVLAAARGALHEVRSSGDEQSGTGTSTPNGDTRPRNDSRSPQHQHHSKPFRSASSHSSYDDSAPNTPRSVAVVAGVGSDGVFQSEIEGDALPALMDLEAALTEELALLEDKESLVKDKRMSVSTTLLAQRNQLLMKNAPEDDIGRLNDRISKTMERVNSAMGQIQDRKRRTQHRIGLVRAEMMRKRRTR